MDQPLEIHWRAAKRILNFVQETRIHGIFYKAKSDLDLIRFTDRDWAGDNKDKNSTSGYVFMLTKGPIICSSKKHSAIALSSIEAEYRGVVNAIPQCLWLQGLLGECGFGSEYSNTIYCDSQSTIRIYNDPVQKQRTKHIEIHMHYIRQLMHDGTIHLLFCSSSEKVADIFTKVFCENTFINLKSLLGIADHAVKHE